MSHLSLKITAVGLGLTKTMQFSGDMSVYEVCREIREKFGEGAGGQDHGLMAPDSGKWLQPSKLLDFYDLVSGDSLEYRKKHRPLKVKTMDNSVKTVLIDESLNVQQLVEIICERIGIQNPEEYSILPERSLEAAQQGVGKDAKTQPKAKVGLDTLAGDQTKWLHPDKTLREQGVNEEDTVMLKKKFFFTDQNIDRNDPVQLNLMFNQAKEMIISGKHPCTAEEACQFAAIQMQVQYGNHEPDKHKAGFIKVKEYIPPEYQKDKNLEKRIYTEHSKLQGLTELNAKFRYVQLSRSLKTYGITFFYVEDETAKKKKDSAMLLGITKQSVVKLDPLTKEIIREWRLTQLRRWAASPNSFTMDFGDYAEAYFSVRTKEGEQISQLIAGYIDIIIKKRKEAEKVVEIDEEEQATLEEYVTPSRATNVGVVTAGARTAVETKMSQPTMMADGMRAGWGRTGANIYPVQYGVVGGGYTARTSEISGAQQTVMQSISNGFAMVNNAANDMNHATNLPPLGNDAAAVQWKQNTVDVNAEAVAAQIIANLAAAGSLVNNATGAMEEMDYEVIGANIVTMTSNLGQMAQGIKLLAGLQENHEDQEHLLAAGREIAIAAAKFLEAAQPLCMGQTTGREEFFNHAKEVSAASANLLMLMGRLDVDDASQDDLLQAAKYVTKYAMDLINTARPMASGTKDPDAQAMISFNAQRVGETCPALVACLTAVCPAITNTQCFEQFAESAMLLRDAVEQLVLSSEAAGNPKLEKTMKESAQRVAENIAKLVEKAKRGGNTSTEDPFDIQHDAVLNSIDQMFQQIDTVDGVVNGARDLTMIAMQYVNMLKGLGLDVEDSDEKNRLLYVARSLGDATSKMVAAAKDSSRNLNDPAARGRLEDAILSVRAAANEAAGPQLRNKAFNRLVKAVRDSIASSNQLISASRATAQSNRNQASQLQLNQAARRINEITPALTTAMKNSASEPENMAAQLKLIEAAKKFIAPCASLIAMAKVSVPTIADTSSQSSMINTMKQTEDDVSKLERAFILAEEASAGMEMESAVYSLQVHQEELTAAASNPAALVPIEGYTAEMSQTEILNAVKALQNNIAHLAGGVQQRNEKVAGNAATDAVAALQSLSFAALALASVENDFSLRQDLLNAANGVTGALSNLLASSKEVGQDPKRQAYFESEVQGISEALGDLTKFLPGQRELDKAITQVHQVGEQIRQKGLSTKGSSGVTFQAAQSKLQAAATGITVSANGLVIASRASPEELKQYAQQFGQAYTKLGDASGVYAGTTQDEVAKGHITHILVDVAQSSEKLLTISKASALDPSNAVFRTQLMNEAKSISERVNKLLDVCSASAPGHAECNIALQGLNDAAARLDSVNDASSNQDSYAESIAKASDSYKSLSAILASIVSNARSGSVAKIASDAAELSNHISSVTDSNVRAAYMVGVSDESSIPAIPPIVDQASLANFAHDIKEACRKLVDEGNSQQQILEIAGTIAKQTGGLCSACKVAAANPQITSTAKANFLNASKDIATRTSALVETIKLLALKPSAEARNRCHETSVPLTDAIDKLLSFAVSPEFAGTEAKMGSAALAAQKPILEASQAIILAGQEFLGTVKMICSNPKDEGSQQMLQAHSRALVDAVQGSLQTVTTSAPGQKECSIALEKLSQSVVSVDSAIVEATVNNLAPQAETMNAAALVDTARAMASLCDVLAKAAKEDATGIGASVNELPASYERASLAAICLASNMVDMHQQMSILEQIKALGEAMNAFVYAAKANGGNGKNAAGGKKVEEEKAKVRTAVSKLVATLEGSRDESGEFTKAVETIESTLSSVDSKIPDTVQKAYHLYEEDAEAVGKQIVATVGDVIAKAKTPAQFRQMAGTIATLYDDMCTKGGCAVRATSDTKVQESIKDGLRGLGASGVKLIEAIRHASGKSAADQASRAKLSAAAREVSISVANMMGVVKEGSKGILQCKMAMEDINSIVADLEGNLIFAQAGQLDPVDVKDNFARHKDPLLSAARASTEELKAYIGAVGATQDELATVVTASVTALSALRDKVRLGATAVTSADKHMQQQLLNSAKAVSEGLQALIASAINACGRSPDDPAMMEFAEKLRTEFLAMRELIRGARVLGDEATRGTRALEGAMAEIDEALGVLTSVAPAQGTALPDEVAGSAKLLATAAAALVSAASGKQEDIVASANAIKKQMEDLIRSAKAATEKAPPEQKGQMVDAVRKAGDAVKNLLARLKTQQEHNNPDNKTKVQMAAKDVALSVNAIVTAASALLPAGYVDANDPNVIAERELLAAAASIDAAARKLASLAPPRPKEINEDLNFEEQIVEAAKAIAAATAGLVRSATGAQRELVAKGRTGPKEEAMYFSDGTWSDGLVSAAKTVAGATGDLCDTANQAMKGKLERERVIVSAKAVSSSTIQLLSAATARADPNSQAQIRLRAAGKAVTNSTDNLVRAAQQNLAFDDADQFSSVMSASGKGGVASSRVAEMDAQVAILKMEKELEKARMKLASVRKGRYDAGKAGAAPTPAAAPAPTPSKPGVQTTKDAAASLAGVINQGAPPKAAARARGQAQ
ncbi:uncharacterized protein EV422DRAFT_576151 [Fimicolochytrium jonesii]|uniref:uncharacterized protein n=1 Tax=Fimicolochytrium jonesii TaxID=1396493 RepID=UPI0022FE64B3|nr:uncharacterized protein EV422DRAFT_576151 [Fimicolochytrium jonesii]KAI8824903.1 hypothetical protein EV422DRAFT_576151 [Fimicolochytrium jonesii]